MTNDMTDKFVATAADREAAASVAPAGLQAGILSGDMDGGKYVRAFTMHRNNALTVDQSKVETDMADKVEVTQADREAAADMASALEFELAVGGNDLAAIRLGVWDNVASEFGALVQAFARHRTTSTAQLRAERDELVEIVRRIVVLGGHQTVEGREAAFVDLECDAYDLLVKIAGGQEPPLKRKGVGDTKIGDAK